MKSRFRMKLELDRQHLAGGWLFRTISEGDVEALGALMLDAYRGTIDYEGETLEDATTEVWTVLAGGYGAFLKDSSYVIEDEERLLSASMVVFSEELGQPLLVFSMTHPDHKRKGMAEFLVKASINALLGEAVLLANRHDALAEHRSQVDGLAPGTASRALGPGAARTWESVCSSRSSSSPIRARKSLRRSGSTSCRLRVSRKSRMDASGVFISWVTASRKAR